MRIGGEGRHKRAVKVWEKREFRNFDNERELGTRTIKIALRRLRRFAREGRADELDLDATDRRHRAPGLARHPHAAGAAQCGEAAPLPGRRRFDGSARARGGGAVQRRHQRI